MNVNRTVSISGAVTTAVEVSSESGLYSNKSFTLLMNPDPEVDSAEISSLSEDLKTFEARILGRAHDLEGEFDSAAMEFTEIIQWDISKLNEKDLATWMDVTSSVRFCAAITEEWADYVKEYKQERLRIIERWNEEAPGLAKDLDKAPPKVSFIWEASPAEEAEAALTELKNELQGQEETAYKNLDSRGEELSDDLKNGPTPESVQRLISGGYVTWSYFNLGGDVEGIPIDVDPVEMAEELVDYIDDPNGYEGDVSQVIALLNNIGIVAMDRQNNGGTLTREELDFLTSFYGSLEEQGDRYPISSGVLTIANLISHNNEIPERISEQLLGALGSGILVLSDERILGSYDHLPESVKEVVEGVENISGNIGSDWYEKASVLAEMMGGAIPDLEGGEQFSVNLTQTLAHVLDVAGGDGEVLLTPKQLESLLDVSTRNEDSNHAILTGEGQYEHPIHGLDPELTLRGLYTYDWPDDSEAITGLTDWIWQESDGQEHERLRAAEAAVGLIENLYGQKNEFLDTGAKVGNNPNAAITEINPTLAESLSRIFFTHIDSFGLSWTGDGNEAEVLDRERAKYLPLFNEGDVAVFLDEDSRQNYIQLLMANEEIAPNILLAVVDHEQRTLGSAFFDGDYSPEEYSNESGRLHGLANGAMIAEIESRIEESEAAFEEAKNEAQVKWETAYKVAAEFTSGALGAAPGFAGDVLGTGAGVLEVILEDPMKDYVSDKVNEEMEGYKDKLDQGQRMSDRVNGGHDEARWHIELQLAHVLLKEGIIDLKDLEGAGVLVGEDENINLPISPNEWSDGHSVKKNNMRSIIENASIPGVPEGEVANLIDEYVEAYLESFNEAPGRH